MRDPLQGRFNAVITWADAHRWHAIIGGLVLLFVASLFGGYWIAERLESGDRDRLARDTLEEMKRSTPGEPPAKYARIEDLPGLPKYSEAEPGHPLPTLDEKPRAAKPQQLAAAASSAETWRKNAVPFSDLNSRPLVAIVIDDVGIDRPRSKRAWELPGPLTMSFLPYAKDLRDQARAARARGHELMLHLPMEPTGRADPGPNALLVSLGDAEIKQRTAAALDSFDGYVGVNNHMGSRFTTFRPGMETVLRQFKGRGLMFLDSRTTAQSVGDQVAQEMGVPSVVRHVFLDDDRIARVCPPQARRDGSRRAPPGLRRGDRPSAREHAAGARRMAAGLAGQGHGAGAGHGGVAQKEWVGLSQCHPERSEGSHRRLPRA